MKRKFLSIALAVVMLMASPLTVFAEDYKGGDDWNVTFDGKEMVSSFKSADIDEQIYEKLQPGDSIELQVALKNAADFETDWYMSNEVLRSLEDSQSVAEGGSYTYLLKYVDAEGKETTLYDSENVGGEDATGGEGLHQATGSLDEYLYLDRLAANESGKVLLKVALDGETQGNSYQNTLAVLQMNFAVEPVDDSTVTRTVTRPSDGSDDEPSNRPSSSPVKTGDETPIMLYSLVALAAGLVCVFLVIFRVSRRRREDKEAM